MNKDFSVAVMYAVTPCHAGSGSALGVVDLPIQRERHTNWPVIQASGVKGAFRANFERYYQIVFHAFFQAEHGGDVLHQLVGFVYLHLTFHI